MVKVVIPNKYFRISALADEKQVINELARIQLELDLYAETHKEELDRIKSKIKVLKEHDITSINKYEMLDEVEMLKKIYKVFGRRVSNEDWKALYNIKFNALTSDLNEMANFTPFELEDFLEEELRYYRQIIGDKIESIIRGENPEVLRAFGKENISKAVKLIKKILKNFESGFNYEKILENPYLLKFLLAFDSERGLEKMTIKQNHVAIQFTDKFVWNPLIPLDSVMKLLEPEYSYCTTKRDKQIINFDEIDGHSLQLLYNEFYKKNKKEKREMHGYPTHEIPEGICKIFKGDKETERKFRNTTENTIIICPSTLLLLGMSALKDYRDIVGIVFNEGLKHIDDEACSGCFNLGKVESTKFPSTLKKIGIKAFYDCPNMLVPILNEGLRYIGDKAFWYTQQGYEDNFIRGSRLIYFPSTVVEVGENIVNTDEIPYTIGFKNYKEGQKIPNEVLGLLYKKEQPPKPPEKPEESFSVVTRVQARLDSIAKEIDEMKKTVKNNLREHSYKPKTWQEMVDESNNPEDNLRLLYKSVITVVNNSDNYSWHKSQVERYKEQLEIYEKSMEEYKSKKPLYVKNKNTGSIAFFDGDSLEPYLEVELQQEEFGSYEDVNNAIREVYMQAKAIPQEPEDQMH